MQKTHVCLLARRASLVFSFSSQPDDCWRLRQPRQHIYAISRVCVCHQFDSLYMRMIVRPKYVCLSAAAAARRGVVSLGFWDGRDDRASIFV